MLIVECVVGLAYNLTIELKRSVVVLEFWLLITRIGGPDATKEVTVQVKISARHGHLSAEHQTEIQEKAEKLLHYFERLTFIEVTVDLQHEDKIVEVIALAEHKQEFIGVDNGKDLIVTLGHAIDKVKHQINHYKERIQDHRRNPSHGGPEGIHP